AAARGPEARLHRPPAGRLTRTNSQTPTSNSPSSNSQKSNSQIPTAKSQLPRVRPSTSELAGRLHADEPAVACKCFCAPIPRWELGSWCLGVGETFRPSRAYVRGMTFLPSRSILPVAVLVLSSSACAINLDAARFTEKEER